MTTSILPSELTDHLDEVRRLCERYAIKELYIFGSAVQGTFNPATSDFDFMVDLGEYGTDVAARYFDLLWALEALLEREVDLITVRSRGDTAFLAEAEATRVAVYAA